MWAPFCLFDCSPPPLGGKLGNREKRNKGKKNCEHLQKQRVTDGRSVLFLWQRRGRRTECGWKAPALFDEKHTEHGSTSRCCFSQRKDGARRSFISTTLVYRLHGKFYCARWCARRNERDRVPAQSARSIRNNKPLQQITKKTTVQSRSPLLLLAVIKHCQNPYRIRHRGKRENAKSSPPSGHRQLCNGGEKATSRTSPAKNESTYRLKQHPTGRTAGSLLPTLASPPRLVPRSQQAPPGSRTLHHRRRPRPNPATWSPGKTIFRLVSQPQVARVRNYDGICLGLGASGLLWAALSGR